MERRLRFAVEKTERTLEKSRRLILKSTELIEQARAMTVNPEW
jgi:hypothetical protein